MKNISLIINIVLAIAVGILFFLVFQLKGQSGKKTKTTKGDSTVSVEPLKVLLVRTDTLIYAYQYANILNQTYNAELEPDILKVQSLEKQLQSAYYSYQKNGPEMTQREQAKEQEKIAKLEQSYQKLAAEVQQKAAYAEQEILYILSDTLKNAFKHFADLKGVDVVMPAAPDMYVSNEDYDITEEMIEFLNSRFAMLNVPNLMQAGDTNQSLGPVMQPQGK